MIGAVAGLAAGIALVAVGLDGACRREGAAAWLPGALSFAGLALSAVSLLILCVPGFFSG